MYVAAGDGSVRLISPVHGGVVTMMFPIMDHRLVDVFHDIGAKVIYALLENGSVMVFSTHTNPCRYTHHLHLVLLKNLLPRSDNVTTVRKL